MHKDFKDLLSAFNARNVRYMIVGGYAYSRYTEPRTTKDLDIFVSTSIENAHLAYEALAEFGAPLSGIRVDDFTSPSTILQIGVAPFRIDIIFSIDGVSFNDAWATSEPALVDDTIPVRYISSDNLIINKLASGRPQDLLDVENLQRAAKFKERNSESRRQ